MVGGTKQLTNFLKYLVTAPKMWDDEVRAGNVVLHQASREILKGSVKKKPRKSGESRESRENVHILPKWLFHEKKNTMTFKGVRWNLCTSEQGISRFNSCFPTKISWKRERQRQAASCARSSRRAIGKLRCCIDIMYWSFSQVPITEASFGYLNQICATTLSIIRFRPEGSFRTYGWFESLSCHKHFNTKWEAAEEVTNFIDIDRRDATWRGGGAASVH